MTRSLPQRGGPQPASGPSAGHAATRPVALRAKTSSSFTATLPTRQMEQPTAPTAKQVKVYVVEPRQHPYLLSNLGFVVSQAKLDESRHHFNIPRSILIRVPQAGELPHHACEDTREIAFPLIVFECGVRLSLALFVRRLLSEFPLHPLQITLALWEHCISQCVLWHRIHRGDPSCKELLSCVEIKQLTDKRGTYYPYSSTGRVIRGMVATLS